jgi:hypothetical protein
MTQGPDKQKVPERPSAEQWDAIERDPRAVASLVAALSWNGAYRDIAAVLTRFGYNLEESQVKYWVQHVSGGSRAKYLDYLMKNKRPPDDVAKQETNYVRAQFLAMPETRPQVWRNVRASRIAAIRTLERPDSTPLDVARTLTQLLGMELRELDDVLIEAVKTAGDKNKLAQRLRQGVTGLQTEIEQREIDALSGEVMTYYKRALALKYSRAKFMLDSKARALVVALVRKSLAGADITVPMVRFALREKTTVKNAGSNLAKLLGSAKDRERRQQFIAYELSLPHIPTHIYEEMEREAVHAMLDYGIYMAGVVRERKERTKHMNFKFGQPERRKKEDGTT